MASCLKAVDQLRQAAGADVVVLSVGTTLQRKKLELLAPALQAAAKISGKKFALLRIGDPLSPALAEEIAAVVGRDAFLELGRVDEATLWQAYRSVDLLLFPSLHEGFGLPVLEALACGSAVACSNTTSLPEVGGDVAEYFDPSAADAAAAAIMRCIDSESPDRPGGSNRPC